MKKEDVRDFVEACDEITARLEVLKDAIASKQARSLVEDLVEQVRETVDQAMVLAKMLMALSALAGWSALMDWGFVMDATGVTV